MDMAEAEAKNKVQGRVKQGEGVCLANMGQMRSQSCHPPVRNQNVNPQMMAHKVKKRSYHPGQGHGQSG